MDRVQRQRTLCRIHAQYHYKRKARFAPMQVRLENVTKKFPGVTAVNTFSVTLPDGELICLLGPSGCGKSTILNMLSGILPVSGGDIYFDEDNVTKLPPEERGIGLVFQNYALYPHMTVLENICFPLEIKRVPKDERVARATRMAKLVHVDMLLNRRHPINCHRSMHWWKLAYVVIKGDHFYNHLWRFAVFFWNESKRKRCLTL